MSQASRAAAPDDEGSQVKSQVRGKRSCVLPATRARVSPPLAAARRRHHATIPPSVATGGGAAPPPLPRRRQGLRLPAPAPRVTDHHDPDAGSAQAPPRRPM